ncbi:hypothetical protein, partial [Mucilaginibacter sp.]|uniref:hypothetical protein n=1 Tax=Mucilaginibacter sp. TaxID=1882438 RepID=UPI0028518546
VIGFILSLVVYFSCNSPKTGSSDALSAADTVTTSITISPNVPFDINDPSNLAEAADYAWKEFIALTWPAQAQGPVTFARGQALPGGTYGDKGPTGQVVWETFRHRVEAFPGQGNPNGYDPSKPDYGYNTKPDYIYAPGNGVPNNGMIPPFFKDSDTSQIVFDNLDEVTQITLNSMYAGISEHGKSGPQSSATSTKSKILFEAKVNDDYYTYVAKNKYFQSDSTSVQNIKTNSAGYAVTGDAKTYPSPYTNLPSSNASAKQLGSIEIKAAWRRLNPAIEDTSKFYKAIVRYYSGTVQGGIETVKGYINSNDKEVNEIWGLVALHIIHKSPNAPAFVYATFSHYDNILDTAGNSVEDMDGTTLPQYLKQPPFSPALNIVNSSPPNNPQQVSTAGGQVNTNSPQLYFRNAAGKEAITDASTGKPYTQPVNINRRIYPIPPIIVNANKTAHAAITKVNPKAVWLNYKLVNVQAQPLDYVRDSTKIAGGLAPTYFLANEVVETNPTLQHFSGGLLVNGACSNYLYSIYTGKVEYDNNVFIRSSKDNQMFLMGGCMGCHGSQGQKLGGDFSVLLANGRISNPDIVEVNEANAALIRAISKAYRLSPTNMSAKKKTKIN